MVSFILIISFLLHIVTFAAIYQLLKQIQMIKQSNTIDIEEVLDNYLEEIREENNRLQKAVSGSQTDKQATSIQQSYSSDITADTTDPANHQIYENEKKDHLEASLHSKVLQLHDKGLSESEIAQKLNCGKTEAALIIKLYSKK